MQLSTTGAQPTGRAQTADESDDGVIVIAGKRYLTLQRFARTLKKSTRTISRWNEQRRGPPCTKIGNLSLIDEEKLPGWLAQYEPKSVKPGRRR